MSYILDALRKADAQRARGAVPDLAAQPLDGPGADAPTPRRRLGLPTAALAMLAVLGAAVLWWTMRPEPAPAPPAPPAAEPARSAAAEVVPAPVPAPVAAAVAPLPTPRLPEPPTTEVSLLPLPRPSAGAGASGPAAAPASVPGAAAPQPVPARLPRLAELAPELRQQVPTLAIGGAMHSEQAERRMLIVNGQLYREGEQPAPGVVLERIQLKSAVLSVRGTRFEIAY